MSSLKFKITKAWINESGTQVSFRIKSKDSSVPKYWGVGIKLAAQELQAITGGKDLRPIDLLLFAGAKVSAEDFTVNKAGTTYENKAGQEIERDNDQLEVSGWDFRLNLDSATIVNKIRKSQKPVAVPTSGDEGITKVSKKDLASAKITETIE